MTIAEGFLEELESETPKTRTFLARIPQDKLAWRPHPRSMTAGQLGLHIASAPGNVVRMVMEDETPLPDLSVLEAQPVSVSEILAAFDSSPATARALLPQLADDRVRQTYLRLLDVPVPSAFGPSADEGM